MLEHAKEPRVRGGGRGRAPAHGAEEADLRGGLASGIGKCGHNRSKKGEPLRGRKASEKGKESREEIQPVLADDRGHSSGKSPRPEQGYLAVAGRRPRPCSYAMHYLGFLRIKQGRTALGIDSCCGHRVRPDTSRPQQHRQHYLRFGPAERSRIPKSPSSCRAGRRRRRSCETRHRAAS